MLTIAAAIAAAILAALAVTRIRKMRQQRLYSVLIVTETHLRQLAELDDRYQRLMGASRNIRDDVNLRASTACRPHQPTWRPVRFAHR